MLAGDTGIELEALLVEHDYARRNPLRRSTGVLLVLCDVAAEVIDESFRGKNRVQQQRAVYAALKGKMDGSHGELHALALTTKVPQ